MAAILGVALLARRQLCPRYRRRWRQKWLGRPADYDVWRSHSARSAATRCNSAGLMGACVFAIGPAAAPRSRCWPPRWSDECANRRPAGWLGDACGFATRTNGQVTQVWTRPGLGGFQGATQFQGQHENSGVALGDINGDGDLETLYATQGESGQARLVAASPNGGEVWHTDFDVTGGKRIFNEPGLHCGGQVTFTSAHEDVLVQIMRGIGGTGEFHMLSGLTGDALDPRLWQQPRQRQPAGSRRGPHASV